MIVWRSRLTPWLTVLIFLTVVGLALAGCSESKPSPTTTAVPTASPSPTPNAAATPRPSPSPTAEALPEPDDLVDRINASMPALAGFRMESELVLRASKAAETELLTLNGESEGIPGGDGWSKTTVQTIGEGAGFAFRYENRIVGGVKYLQDPFTKQWTVNDSPSQDSLAKHLAEGRLRLEGMLVRKDELDGLAVYVLSGTALNVPWVDTVSLMIGAADGLIRSAEAEGRVDASEFEGLIPQDVPRVYVRQVHRFSRLGQRFQIEAPEVRPSPTAVTVELWEVYSNSALGLSMRYPRGWRLDTAGGPPSAFWIGHPDGPVVTGGGTPLGAVSLEEFVDDSVVGMGRSNVGFVETSRTKVDAMDGYLVEGTARDGTLLVKALILRNKDFGILVSFMTPKGESEAYQPLLDRMLDSVQISSP